MITVVEETKTCDACPTQWEGKLSDGKVFYFRYRGGQIRFSVGETLEEAVRGEGNFNFTQSRGSWLDGFMEDDEYHKLVGLALSVYGIPYQDREVLDDVFDVDEDADREQELYERTTYYEQNYGDGRD